MSNTEYSKKFNPFVKMIHYKVRVCVGDNLSYEGVLTACYNDDMLEVDKKLLIPVRSIKALEKLD